MRAAWRLVTNPAAAAVQTGVFDPAAANLDGFAFLRASTAYLNTDGDGLYNEYGINVPRIDNDGYILMEGARTNLLTDPVDLTDAAWTSNSGSLSVGSAIADPAGGTDAWPVTKTGTSTLASLYEQSDTIARDTRLSFSTSVMGAGGATALSMSLYNSTAAGHTPASGLVLAGPGSAAGSSRIFFDGLSASEWSRVSLSLDDVIDTGQQLRTLLYAGGHPSTTVGHGSNLWMPMVEVGPIPSSPYAGTRAADTLRTTTARPPWRSIAVKIKAPIVALNTGGFLLHTLWYATTELSDRIWLFISGSTGNLILSTRRDGTTADVALEGLTWVPGQEYRVCASWHEDTGEIHLCRDGGAVSSFTEQPVTDPSIFTEEELGQTNGTANWLFGGIGKVTRSTACLTGASLQAFGA